MDKPQAQPEPEKYIRTFAGDMETLKAGGTPDLVALAKHSPPAETAPNVPLEREMPLPEPVPAYVPAPKPLARVETYESDFSEKIQETQASQATVLAAEQDAQPLTVPTEPEKFSRKNLIYLIAGSLLLIVSIVGASIAIMRYLNAQAPIATISAVSAPIFVDEREEIASPDILKMVEQSLARPLASGNVRLLYASSTDPSRSGALFTTLLAEAPAVLLRNVNVDGSMVGVVFVEGKQSLFFILSVSSYSNTFSGMLTWETTMTRSLGKFFPSYSQTSVSTTTTATTTPLIVRSSAAFVDATVANHDVRVYRDAAGRDIVLYGYWNQTTLVIVRDVAAFTEILQRLATSRAQP